MRHYKISTMIQRVSAGTDDGDGGQRDWNVTCGVMKNKLKPSYRPSITLPPQTLRTSLSTPTQGLDELEFLPCEAPERLSV